VDALAPGVGSGPAQANEQENTFAAAGKFSFCCFVTEDKL